jgi:hypothetical protein
MKTALAIGNRCSGPAPGEETCGCGPTGTFGLVSAADPRYLGGHVDREGYRHDPLVHAVGCPRLSPSAVDWPS